LMLPRIGTTCRFTWLRYWNILAVERPGDVRDESISLRGESLARRIALAGRAHGAPLARNTGETVRGGKA
jgi:hypothetical protein